MEQKSNVPSSLSISIPLFLDPGLEEYLRTILNDLGIKSSSR
jgi:hypothetical protein